MGFAFGLIFLIFAVPLGFFIYWVTVMKPAQGRQTQDRVWKPVAARLGAQWVASPGGTRFHAMNVRVRDAVVTATVLPHAPVDPAIKSALWLRDPGGWRTFVTRGWSGAGLPVGDEYLQKHHRVEALLGTHPHWIHARLSYDLHRALATIGDQYRYITVGPQFVCLELFGVTADPARLEAAITVVGELAATSAAAVAPSAVSA